MTIRRSTKAEIDTIMQLIDEGRKKMVAEGNTRQWTLGQPSRQLVETDVSNGNSYMMTDGDEIVATFALVKGPDPTYAVICDGQWLNDRPYYVIHRIASSPKVHGVLHTVLDYAFRLTDTIRIDTHEDNRTMQSLLRKQGFTYCGIIHLANGDPRLAFQKSIT